MAKRSGCHIFRISFSLWISTLAFKRDDQKNVYMWRQTTKFIVCVCLYVALQYHRHTQFRLKGLYSCANGLRFFCWIVITFCLQSIEFCYSAHRISLNYILSLCYFFCLPRPPFTCLSLLMLLSSELLFLFYFVCVCVWGGREGGGGREVGKGPVCEYVLALSPSCSDDCGACWCSG